MRQSRAGFRRGEHLLHRRRLLCPDDTGTEVHRSSWLDSFGITTSKIIQKEPLRTPLPRSDYFIVGLAKLLGPLTNQPVDLAGALISPLIGLIGAWFLWWWIRLTGPLKFGWLGLVLYAVSPILVHGRAWPSRSPVPAHRFDSDRVLCRMDAGGKAFAGLGYRAGAPGRLALWVSLYEPGILFALLFLPALLVRRGRARVFSSLRNPGMDLLCRDPRSCPPGRTPYSFSAISDRAANSLGIGCMALASFDQCRSGVRAGSTGRAISFCWCRWLVVLREDWWEKSEEALFELSLLILLGITFGLTMWQARWSLLLSSVFVLLLPWLFQASRIRWMIWVAFFLSLWPVARDWDNRLWPNEDRIGTADRTAAERSNLRELAAPMRSAELAPILASVAFPVAFVLVGTTDVAGSSHESIARNCRYGAVLCGEDEAKAREIIERRDVRFVLAYDSERTAANCSEILGQSIREHAVCYVLNRAPAESLGFLVFAAQNRAGKVFRIANNR